MRFFGELVNSHQEFKLLIGLFLIKIVAKKIFDT